MLFNLFHVLLVVSLLVVCLDLGLEEIRAARRIQLVAPSVALNVPASQGLQLIWSAV